MASTEHPLQALADYLPKGAFEKVEAYLLQYKVHLTITKARKSVLGDYRNAVYGKNHRISINSNLNKYAFLTTLLHELAHLLTYEKFGHKVAAHGNEWKKLYSSLLATFIQHHIFPADIEKALQKSLRNPAASSCAEEELTRALKKYDERKNNIYLVEELNEQAFFKTNDGRVFQRCEKLRKRYKCKEISTGNIYLFSGMYEVEKLFFFIT